MTLSNALWDTILILLGCSLLKKCSFDSSTDIANEKDFLPLFLFIKTLNSPSILIGGKGLRVSKLMNLAKVSP